MRSILKTLKCIDKYLIKLIKADKNEKETEKKMNDKTY